MRDPMHRKQRILSYVSAVLLLMSVANQSAADTGESLPMILANNSGDAETWLPDFSFAGYRNGNEPLPVSAGTVVDVDQYGAVANDHDDDTRAILAALEKAHSIEGPVIVRFSAGRYRVTGVLKIEQSNIVLQGKGSGIGGTTLWFPRPLNQLDKSSSLDELRKYLVDLDKRQREPDRNLDEYFSEYSWSGGFIWIQKARYPRKPLTSLSSTRKSKR